MGDKTNVNCCHYCTDRTIMCHAICRKYAEEAARNAAMRDARNAIKAQESDMRTYICDHVSKNTKRSAKK
jgi:hypothetical protein